MSPEQKTLVQETWRHVMPIADTAASLFYQRLFEVDPKTRDLFEGVDLAGQGMKLTQAINMVVVALDRLDDLSPVVAALGRRHADYGVTDAHYDTVGAALIWTLEKGLGELWSEDAKAAWLAAYTVLADIMKSAAADIDDSQTARHASGVAV